MGTVRERFPLNIGYSHFCMQIQLCKKSIERLGPAMAPLLEELRERYYTPTVKDCLNRCQNCERGLIVVTAEGLPMAAHSVEKLLSDLEQLADEDS